jgi:hypothetical protein
MNKSAAQQQIRELSPQYLEQHPVGTVESLAAIWAKFGPQKVEFRKPFVRILDELDEKPVCQMCDGSGECYICEDQAVTECPYCSGQGCQPFNYNQVFLMVYRDFRSVECLVEVQKDGTCVAEVTVAESGFKAGDKIELTPEEQDLARTAVKWKE